MQQYRYQIFDNEPPEPSSSIYTRILGGCYAKGVEAGKTADCRPTNPYKRSDYQLAWETGYDEGFLSHPKHQEEYNQLYENWADEIPV